MGLLRTAATAFTVLFTVSTAQQYAHLESDSLQTMVHKHSAHHEHVAMRHIVKQNAEGVENYNFATNDTVSAHTMS